MTGKINDLLKKWFEHKYINKTEYLHMRSSDLLLPKAYGLPNLWVPPLLPVIADLVLLL